MRNVFIAAVALLSTALVAGKVPEIKWADLAKYDLKTSKPGLAVGKLLGKKIALTGFMIPLDFQKKNVKEFLLVPYFPSCIHIPPPPENQVVMVRSKGAIPASYYPVKISGALKLAKQKKGNELISGGVYEMALDSLKELK